MVVPRLLQAWRIASFNRFRTKNQHRALIAALAACMSAIAPLTCRPATLPPVAPAFSAWAEYLRGAWSCRSASTPYTAFYEVALSGHWIRGINTSGSSQSEDMLTYDAKTQRWTLYDMEPAGTSVAMRGQSTSSTIRLSDNARHFNLALERVSPDLYRLQFLDRNGKPSGKPDVCNRRH